MDRDWRDQHPYHDGGCVETTDHSQPSKTPEPASPWVLDKRLLGFPCVERSFCKHVGNFRKLLMLTEPRKQIIIAFGRSGCLQTQALPDHRLLATVCCTK